jgi:hypothetical protein
MKKNFDRIDSWFSGLTKACKNIISSDHRRYEMAKLKSEKWKKSSFYIEKSLVGLPPDLFENKP